MKTGKDSTEPGFVTKWLIEFLLHLDGMLDGMQDGILDSMLDGMLDGMLNGMLVSDYRYPLQIPPSYTQLHVCQYPLTIFTMVQKNNV